MSRLAINSASSSNVDSKQRITVFAATELFKKGNNSVTRGSSALSPNKTTSVSRLAVQTALIQPASTAMGKTRPNSSRNTIPIPPPLRIAIGLTVCDGTGVETRCAHTSIVFKKRLRPCTREIQVNHWLRKPRPCFSQ